VLSFFLPFGALRFHENLTLTNFTCARTREVPCRAASAGSGCEGFDVEAEDLITLLHGEPCLLAGGITWYAYELVSFGWFERIPKSF
jgi:hypothetical protein